MKLLAIAAVAMVAAACAMPPPSTRVATAVPRASSTSIPTEAPRTVIDPLILERHAREITLRVRSVQCDQLGVGSAVAIGTRLLATNRHVVDGAKELDVETWDGRILRVDVSEIAQDQDLALVRVNSDLPAIAQSAADALAGDRVSAVGFPGGGQFQQLPGILVDYVDGSLFGEQSRIMRATIPVQHGNSGGAVLNERGGLVGIVFAIETRTGYGLAIPASTLQTSVAAAAFAPTKASC